MIFPPQVPQFCLLMYITNSILQTKGQFISINALRRKSRSENITNFVHHLQWSSNFISFRSSRSGWCIFLGIDDFLHNKKDVDKKKILIYFCSFPFTACGAFMQYGILLPSFYDVMKHTINDPHKCIIWIRNCIYSSIMRGCTYSRKRQCLPL